MTRSGSPLLSRLQAGESRELRLLAARGLLPVPPEELIPLQVAMAQGDDAELAEEAAAALAAAEAKVMAWFLAHDAGPEELSWFAVRTDDPLLIETLLRRRDVPRPLLVGLAPRLPPDLQERLLLRQDAIVEEPAILDALADNPRLTRYARRRIREYRQHLIPRQPTAEPEEEVADTADGELDEASDEETRDAIARVRERPAPGDADDATGLTEGQIRLLPVAVRVHLARGANRSLRSMLLRDPNRQVALAVMRFNPLSDSEIEQVAGSRLVGDDVFDEIVRRRDWIGKYPILRALAFNPGLPVGMGVKLVSRLAVRDLRLLSRDRNVSDAVRSTATRLYRIKRS